MKTIGQVAKKFGLSRSTLLFYESIGLLVASVRSEANYRRYSEADVSRLSWICAYRKTGLSLKDIKSLLEKPGLRARALLERRLDELNLEIHELRRQQRVAMRILKNKALTRKARAMNKATWVAILRAAGLSDKEMGQWHVEFERRSPEAHQDFLESLGLKDSEIARIRTRSRRETPSH